MSNSYIKWMEYPPDDSNIQRLFYYTPPSHLIENLKKGRIKVSTFDKCNDLFELASFSLKEKQVRKRHKVWLENCSKNVGLICLSEKWRNQVMWGHYANSGTGACLVFEVNRKNLSKVSYVNERIAVGESYNFPTPEQKNAFHTVCSKKSSHWKYENEWRLFVDFSESSVETEGQFTFRKMNNDLTLVGIINGPKPTCSKDEILKACGNNEGLHYFQCRASFKEYTMVVQQAKNLWK